MQKIFLTILLCFISLSVMAQSTAQQVLPGTYVTSGRSAKYVPASSTTPIPVGVYTSATSGYVLTSNGSGVATFQAASGGSLTAPVYIGTASFTAAGTLLQATSDPGNTFNQIIIQNTDSGSAASTNFIVNNNLGTNTTYYGKFGMNSSTFAGSGSFNLPNAVYLDSRSGDLSLGTLTSNSIHFVVNNGSADTLTIGTAGITVPAFSTAGIVANSAAGLLSSTANPTFKVVGFTIDGAGSALSTGQKGYYRVPFSGTITGYSLIPDQSCSAVVDVWKVAGGGAGTLTQPTVANTITASALPTLSSSVGVYSTTLTAWTTSVAVGDVFGWNINSVSTCTRLTFELYITTN